MDKGHLHTTSRTRAAMATGRVALLHFVRKPLNWGTLARLRRALDLRDGDRVLDVGCGTGVATAVLSGRRADYVGIDMHGPSVGAARHLLDGRPRFVRMDAAHLGFCAQAFDRAVVMNVVHHLSDTALDSLFAELGRVVRTHIVLCDWAPDSHNAISAWIARHDRGDHIRDRTVLRRLLSQHFIVQYEEVFMNQLHVVPQVLFALTPRHAPPASA